MNRSIALIALFFGAFLGVNKAEAMVGPVNIFKGLEIFQWNPLDPRVPHEESAEDDANQDKIPEIRSPVM